MKRLLLIPFLVLAFACSSSEGPDEPGCTDCNPPPLCEAPQAPAGCPPARVVETVDLVTGCPALACGACPQVEVPACEDGTLRAVRDAATECPTAWTCETCDPPAEPVCEGGFAVPLQDENGCTTGWTCEACPSVEPAVCADATEQIDPATGCLAGWNCPACPEPEVPSCRTGDPFLETDAETGCSAWVCPPCPQVEEPVCTTGDALPTTDPETGCPGWSCPPCPQVEEPECTTGDALPTTDPETGCADWACPACPSVEPATCAGATPIVDGITGCTTGWFCPDPSDRWSSADGLTGTALAAALRDLIDGHTVLGYNGARDEMFDWIDVHNGVIECIYTGRTTAPNGTRTPGGFNTEHSWPQSEGAAGTAKSDIHHLFPTDATANNRRSSYSFGETNCNQSSACAWYEGGSELGSSNAGGGTIFEVRPPYRGDIARAHFYFSVRYNMRIHAGEETVLRAWHLQDPPSDRERLRNDRIETVQHNRNPFVDRPEFVDRILDF